jgi:hypothetical protein
MPVEMGLWRVDDKPVRLVPGGMPTEARLEELIEAEPTILGEPLLIIGRQVATSFGKIIDLLAVDADGILHVLELKKDKTPREVIAQVLDYGSWVRSLTHADVLKLFADYGKRGAFEAAFQQRFDAPPPEELNTGHRLTIIASAVDVATERIIEYLAEAYAVPVNVVFFRYFEDGGHRYLGRTWLIEQDRAPEPIGTPKSKELWNGRDWYVSFGEFPDGRQWEDAVKYGFVSAGGGDWYSRSIRKLPVGARIFTHIPKAGYVGVGVVTGEPMPFTEATVDIDGQQRSLADLSLDGNYVYASGDEWVVPVRWIKHRPREKAFWKTGMFANQNSATKLRNRFTLDQLAAEFGLDDDSSAESDETATGGELGRAMSRSS